MTIKLLQLKSGEDVIANVEEMSVGEDAEKRIIGYYLNKACVVKLRNPNLKENKKGYEVSLFPWMPLSAEDTIPIVADWVVTIVEPVEKLVQMYTEDVVNGTNSQNNSVDEQ
nr:hypothetical protein [uncultured Mediterranean phage uvMED]